ncbi:MAG: trypsin-like peptidase domain-containing protein [Gemmatimonadota bacterium]
MNDALRAKLSLMLTAGLAFTVGLGAAIGFDLIPPGHASGALPPLRLAEAPAQTTANAVPVSIQSAQTVRDGASAPVADFTAIADIITPSVVTVFTEVARPRANSVRGPVEPGGRRRGSGSGFVISEDGYLMTNNHVVDGALRIDVQLADGRRFEQVRLVGQDPTTDVALLKLDASGLTPAVLGSSDETRVGEWVLAVGSPGFAPGGPGPRTLTTTVTAGIVSAKGRSLDLLGSGTNLSLAIEDFIQTDAAINPGNSGGPLVNARGEVIGINTAILTTTTTYQGYSFAVPIDLAREVIEDFVEHGEVRRAVLGIAVRGVQDSDAQYLGLDRVAGAMVSSASLTESASPAERAGVRIGDVITAVNGEPITSVSSLQRRIRSHEPGDTVSLELVRWDTKERETLRVGLTSPQPGPTQIVSRPQPAGRERRGDPLGLRVRSLTDSDRRGGTLPDGVRGVIIADVETFGPAFRARPGLLEGFVIEQLSGADLESATDYRTAVATLRAGDVVGLIIVAPGGTGRSGQRFDPQRFPVTIRVPNGG